MGEALSHCRLIAWEAGPIGAQFNITTSAEAVCLIGPLEAPRTLARADLTAVMVETHMTGDRVTDVWWLLYGRGGEPALRVPQGSAGEDDMVRWLMLLPGFDIDALAEAMHFRGNATFALWKAPPAAAPG
jgi:hypothetical protein